MIDSLSIAVHAFVSRVSMSSSVDETLLYHKRPAFGASKMIYGSMPDWVVPKTQKMELDAALLNTQHYKIRIEGKVEQSREGSSTLPFTSV